MRGLAVAGDWMPAAKLRSLFDAGLDYDDIAVINKRITGWQPDRSTVLLKRQLQADLARIDAQRPERIGV
jgi:hypothetical protein